MVLSTKNLMEHFHVAFVSLNYKIKVNTMVQRAEEIKQDAEQSYAKNWQALRKEIETSKILKNALLAL